ncbi:hypothetical protein AB0F15_18200 [Amycolatopsis sp. NPDC026612]|uniref:hypothetical protein n=1 Tax=Amycolatopsis sp. NPDC026612 TaxID=3155466 RepID=UPI0033E8251F
MAVASFHPDGDPAEVAARLTRPAAGTTHYLVEAVGEPVAAFSVTELARMRPGAARRLLLHDMRIRSAFRGNGVIEDIFAWLAQSLGAGREVELIALTPMDYTPSAAAPFGEEQWHRAFKWAVSNQQARP